MTSPRLRALGVAGALLAFLLAGFLTWEAARTASLHADDSEHLLSAAKIHRGETPYVDFFQKQSALFWLLLQPAVAAAKGEAPRALQYGRWFTGGCLLLLLLAAWLVARQLSPSKWTALLVPLYLSVSYDFLNRVAVLRPDIAMLVLVLWGIYFTNRYLRSRAAAPLVLAGLLFGAAAVMLLKSLPFSLALFVLLLVALGRPGRRHLLYALAAALLPGALFALYLLHIEALEAFYFFNVVFNEHLYRNPPPGNIHTQAYWLTATLTRTWDMEPWVLVLAASLSLALTVVALRWLARPRPPLRELALHPLAAPALWLLLSFAMLFPNQLIYPSYFFPIKLVAVLSIPWLLDRLVGLGRSPRAKQLLAAGGGLLLTVVLLVAFTRQMDRLYLSPPIERQARIAQELAIAKESRARCRQRASVNDLADLAHVSRPGNRIFHCSDMWIRIAWTFCELERLGRLPEWARARYGADYRGSCD